MAAVVVAPPAPPGAPADGVQLNVFPGSATPAIFPAAAPFWIGSGFVPEPGASAAQGAEPLGPTTRFELDIDGRPVELSTDLEVLDGHPVSKSSIVVFVVGLPSGWHRFAGRWYVADKLVLSSDKSIQFVER